MCGVCLTTLLVQYQRSMQRGKSTLCISLAWVLVAQTTVALRIDSEIVVLESSGYLCIVQLLLSLDTVTLHTGNDAGHSGIVIEVCLCRHVVAVIFILVEFFVV